CDLDALLLAEMPLISVSVKLGQHLVVLVHINIAFDLCLGIVEPRLGAVFAQPVQGEFAKDNSQRELPKAPRDTAANFLIIQEIMRPWDFQGDRKSTRLNS